MSAPITVLVEFAIADGKEDAFVEISKKGLEIVRSKEPGTLSFTQYFNEDRSVAVSLESYADSEAILAHMKNASEDVSAVMQIAKIIRVEIFGNVSDEVKSAFAAFNTKLYQGFSAFSQ